MYSRRVCGLKRDARGARGALGDRVVARAELELDDVADGGVDNVGDERVLRTADDDGDQARGQGTGDGSCCGAYVKREKFVFVSLVVGMEQGS